MMKFVALCLLFALAISQCQAQGCYSLECTNLRFLNVLPALGTANVTAGNNNQLITNAAPGGTTPYSSLNANRYRLQSKFLRGGSCVSQPHPLAEDKHYTLITMRNGNNLENVLVNDDVRAPRNNKNVLLRTGNFLAENTIVTISDQASGRVLFRNLEYGEISNWKEIPAADYTLVWTARNTGNNKRSILQGGNFTCCRRSYSFYVTPSGSVITSAQILSSTNKRSEDSAIVPEFIDLTAEAETENQSTQNKETETKDDKAKDNKAARDVKTDNLSPAQAEVAEKVEARE